ncbi:MAG: hypothetical protein IT436_08130 [Phycisphaerales bacterium]|nr:hypothetical protein [Phycisphaerales bacterium]
MNTWRSLLCTVIVGGLAFSAAGQNSAPQKQPANNPPPAADTPQPGNAGGPRGPRAMTTLSPEKAKAAWELQASGVAKHLGLDADKTKSLTKAYIEARESHTAASDKLRQEAMEKMRDAGNDPQAARGADMMKAMEDLNTAERAKFEKALAGTLNPDQTTKALASLGSFNRQWDTMVDNFAGFGLEPAKQQEGLQAIEQYVVAAAAARTGDRDTMRTAMQEARTKLLDSMKKILSDEQFAKFEASFAPGGRGGPGGPGGGRGGNRGGS